MNLSRLSLFSLTCAAAIMAGSVLASTPLPPDADLAGFRLGEPVTHENLQLFPVLGKAELDKKVYMTLSEAMEKKVVTIHETGNVSQLAVENKQRSVTVFIHSGDIVKGGKQDRTIQYDMIVKPNSGRLPLNSFCVESGRWQKRGGESVSAFSANTKLLSSRNLKASAKYAADQQQVWSNVAAQQSKLSQNVAEVQGRNGAVNVNAIESATSLQLTLENKEVEKTTKLYNAAFEGMPDQDEGVLGYVYAINGEVYGADVYNNRKLFKSLWPKLLESVVTEAVADYDKDKQAAKAKQDDVLAMFSEARKGKHSSVDVNKQTRFDTHVQKKLMYFITVDAGEENTWLHRSYIIPDENASAPQPLQQRNGLDAPQTEGVLLQQIRQTQRKTIQQQDDNRQQSQRVEGQQRRRR